MDAEQNLRERRLRLIFTAQSFKKRILDNNKTWYFCILGFFGAKVKLLLIFNNPFHGGRILDSIIFISNRFL